MKHDVYYNDEQMEDVDQDTQIEHPTEAEDVRNEPEVDPRRSKSRVAQPDRLGAITGDWRDFAFVAITEESEPKDMKKAMNSSKSNHWKAAAANEYDSFKMNKT